MLCNSLFCAILLMNLGNSNHARSVFLLNRGISSQIYTSNLAFYKSGSFMELWKDIQSYEGLYQVSDHGRVKSLDRYVRQHSRGKQLKKGMLINSCKSRKGYLHLGLNKYGKRKDCSVHRLVAKAFVPNPNNYPQINHKDTIKDNNFPTNLEWVNNSMNQKHAYTNGLNMPKIGEKNGNSKLTEDKVVNIIQKLKEGHSHRFVGKCFGVSKSTITRINIRNSWAHVNG